jgi:hypothetical protein
LDFFRYLAGLPCALITTIDFAAIRQDDSARSILREFDIMSPYRAFALLAGTLGAAGFCLAQSAISARSGLIQLTVGSVYVQDKPVHKTVTNMLQVKPSEVLRTGPDGYAEVLLTPGVFLRLGNGTSFRMDSDALTHTHLTLLTGSAMVECDDLLPDNNVAFDVGGKPVELRKKGLYRLEASPAAVATIQGELFVAGNIDTTVTKGRLLQFDSAVPAPVKFHNDKKDELYTFSKARSEDSAYATGVTSSSLLSSGYGCRGGGSSWYLMGGVGMYSYLPCSGMYSNAFGYSFIGLNDGYMWGGPNYYVPPYGLLGYGYGGYAPYGGTAVAGGGGGGTAKPGATAVKGRAPLPAAPVKVPIFAGPNAARNGVAPVAVFRPSSHAAFASGNRSMSPIQSRSLSAAAGPSIGHVSAARSGYSGPAMRGGEGGGMPQGGYSGGQAPRGMSGNTGSTSQGSSGMSAGAGGRSPSGGGGGGTRGK